MLGYGRRWMICWHPEEWRFRRTRMNEAVVGTRWIYRVGPFVVFAGNSPPLGMSDRERRQFRKEVKRLVRKEERIFGR